MFNQFNRFIRRLSSASETVELNNTDNTQVYSSNVPETPNTPLVVTLANGTPSSFFDKVPMSKDINISMQHSYCQPIILDFCLIRGSLQFHAKENPTFEFKIKSSSYCSVKATIIHNDSKIDSDQIECAANIRPHDVKLLFNKMELPTNFSALINLENESSCKAVCYELQIDLHEQDKYISQIKNTEIYDYGKKYLLLEIYGCPNYDNDMNTTTNTSTDSLGTTRECIICMSEEKSVIVLPCRHLCLCGDCAEQLRSQSHKCPICRSGNIVWYL
ncbi:hypothetical protein ROZALSC1DRAFT_22837 [Rozella allomycis CSF55]|uniref:RING-type domain-containing protein n=1 Tax=Rozella allomycis (strain CSF55) TaxID=988480 RepID=A0A4P9YK58_ROZAC|nr:hypothetical protein ROZALSC1DRAFT_22837 [Rozella allomycis CSF55]